MEAKGATFSYYESSNIHGGLSVKIVGMEADGEVVFPSEHEGRPIVEIGKLDTYSCHFCPTSLTIPASVKSIDRFAFMDCKKLKKVIFEEGSELGAICECAFSGCESLSDITLPDSVILVSEAAFSNCVSLRTVRFPKSLAALGQRAFSGCTSLAKVSFNAYCDLADIPYSAFFGCEALTEITIPKKVEIIREGAFQLCTSLRKVIFAKGSKLKTVIHEAFSGTAVSEWNLEPCTSLEFVGESAFSSYNASAIKVIFPMDCKADIHECAFMRDNMEYVNKPESFIPVGSPEWNKKQKKGCYVATCVYGSYDCPEVWTLRRYRDETLSANVFGRAFIKVYYAVSPTLVRWFGKTSLFQKLCRGRLDKMVAKLREKGVESTPYRD